METQELLPPSLVYVTETWKPDIARFRREVEDAQSSGSGDALTLAEMECSLDLIDADLSALRSSNRTDQRTLASIKEVAELKRGLERLIEEMRPLCRD
ncbi:hypothetical protein [Devosia sp. 2618]|uniref:hypothetical protein n=1 Tax=Devosia sp. 2618 TaxID=3156454 RepID=UPI0033926BF6